MKIRTFLALLLLTTTPLGVVGVGNAKKMPTSGFHPRNRGLASTAVDGANHRHHRREDYDLVEFKPRGGARSKTNVVVVDNREATSSPWNQIKKFVLWERFPWLVCSLLSSYYFWIFQKSPSTPPAKNQYSKDGFCVTGLSGQQQVCSKAAGNSHQFAWGIDVLYFLLALSVPMSGLAKTETSLWFWANTIAIAALIGVHGLLHSWISSKNCDLADDSMLSIFSGAVGGPAIAGGPNNNVAYAAFIFSLMVVDLYGFSSIPANYDKIHHGLLAVLAISAAVTGVIVKISVQATSVSSFFMISQVIVSLTGLVCPNPATVTPQLGWAYSPSCVISLLEYLNCGFLVQYGGHAWYDFFLHLSMIVALLFGSYEFPQKVSAFLKL